MTDASAGDTRRAPICSAVSVRARRLDGADGHRPPLLHDLRSATIAEEYSLDGAPAAVDAQRTISAASMPAGGPAAERKASVDAVAGITTRVVALSGGGSSRGRRAQRWLLAQPSLTNSFDVDPGHHSIRSSQEGKSSICSETVGLRPKPSRSPSRLPLIASVLTQRNTYERHSSVCSHQSVTSTGGWMRVDGALKSIKSLLSRSGTQDSACESCRSAEEAVLTAERGAVRRYTEESVREPSVFGDDRSHKSRERSADVASLQPSWLLRQKTAVGGRLIRRQQLYEQRKRCSDLALFFALLGIALMVLENEFTAAEFYDKSSLTSYALKSCIVLTTLVLLSLIIMFHVLETKLFMNDNSAEDWRIAVSHRRVVQICVELTVCSICPVPGDFFFSWTTVHADGKTVTTSDVSLDVMLSIPMFFRLYLLCRVMLLHSRLFTDASSRSIGALNRVNFNARFILKTLMTLCPGTVLLVFTASLWIIASWILRLCERQAAVGVIGLYEANDPYLIQALKHRNYLNSLWMIAITFLSVGYGDIVPNTYCGRAVAVITGIMGAGTSSMVVAVIARKLELTRAEKHVHNFMIDTQLTKRLKHGSANVLRETWLIYKHRRLVDKIDTSKIRQHQRKFLMAIYELRKVKRAQRKLSENCMTVGDVAKTTSNTYEMISDMRSWQEGLSMRMAAVENCVTSMQQDLRCLTQLMTERSGKRDVASPSAASVARRRLIRGDTTTD